MPRILAALLFILFLPLAARAGDGVWQPYDCPWQIDGGRRVECGVLEVPENRAKPDSRTILLHVRIFRAAEETGLEPVVYLSGGPGQDMAFTDKSGMEIWASSIDSWMSWAEGRDVILFSQRGITVDGVGMECPELGDPRVYLGAADRPEEIADWRETVPRANRTCIERLTAQGYDLSAYSTVESAADVEALRAALGYRKWVLFGVSYGTRLGLAVLRDHPAGVSAAILDSVFPPQVRDHWTDAGPFADALYMMLRSCALSPACDRAYPNLGPRLDALLDRLAAAPLTDWVSPPGEDGRLWYRLDDSFLLDLIFFNLYWVEDIEGLPRIIDALDRGDLDLFRDLGANDYVFDQLFTGWSYGMGMAIGCNDDFAWFDPAALDREIAAHPRFANWLGAAKDVPPCMGWPSLPREAGFSEPVTSDIPVLMFSGEYDPVTPVRYADAALPHLANGQLVVVPGVSHSVLDVADCGKALVEEFLSDPLAPLPRICDGQGAGLSFALP